MTTIKDNKNNIIYKKNYHNISSSNPDGCKKERSRAAGSHR
jgi:hypothetical protein